MYGVDVDVDAVEPNRRILLRSPNPNGTGQAKVVWGSFQGDTPDVEAAAADAIEGFTLALAGMKAWLERGIELNLIADRHPPTRPA
jgi:hypothetical protein